MVKIRCLLNNPFSGTFSAVMLQTTDINVSKETYKTLLNYNSVIQLQLSRLELLTEYVTEQAFHASCL